MDDHTGPVQPPQQNDGWESAPNPVRRYKEDLDDTQLFIDTRDACRRHPSLTDFFNEELEGNEDLVEYLTDYVDHIYDAILQHEQVKDYKTAKGGDAEAVKRIKNGYWSNDLVRRTSWNIVIDCIDVQAGRPVGAMVKTRKGAPAPSIIKKDFESWEDRLYKFYTQLWWRKSVCRNWLDADWRSVKQRYLGDPDGIEETKEAEAKSNKIRSDARKAEKARKAGNIDEAEDSDEDTNTVQPPRKKTRTARTGKKNNVNAASTLASTNSISRVSNVSRSNMKPASAQENGTSGYSNMALIHGFYPELQGQGAPLRRPEPRMQRPNAMESYQPIPNNSESSTRSTSQSPSRYAPPAHNIQRNSGKFNEAPYPQPHPYTQQSPYTYSSRHEQEMENDFVESNSRAQVHSATHNNGRAFGISSGQLLPPPRQQREASLDNGSRIVLHRTNPSSAGEVYDFNFQVQNDDDELAQAASALDECVANSFGLGVESAHAQQANISGSNVSNTTNLNNFSFAASDPNPQPDLLDPQFDGPPTASIPTQQNAGEGLPNSSLSNFEADIPAQSTDNTTEPSNSFYPELSDW